MKKIFFVLLSFSKYFSKHFSPTAFRLGVPISLHGLFLTQVAQFWPSERRQYELHRRYIVVGITSSTLYFSADSFFPSRGPRRQYKKRLHDVVLRAVFGQCHRGSINYIVATSSSELHLQHYTFLRVFFFPRGPRRQYEKELFVSFKKKS